MKLFPEHFLRVGRVEKKFFSGYPSSLHEPPGTCCQAPAILPPSPSSSGPRRRPPGHGRNGPCLASCSVYLGNSFRPDLARQDREQVGTSDHPVATSSLPRARPGAPSPRFWGFVRMLFSKLLNEAQRHAQYRGRFAFARQVECAHETKSRSELLGYEGRI